MAEFGELAVIGRRLCEPLTGAGRYLEQLLYHWGRMEIPFRRIVVHVPGEPQVAEDVLRPPIEVGITPLRISPLFWENVALPGRLRQADLIFGTYTLPWFSARRGVVSNLGIYEGRPGDFSALSRLRTTPFFRRSAQQAVRVVANSISTKTDVAEHLKVPPEKIRVVLLGADESLSPGPRELPKEILERYGCPGGPYFLLVGKLSKRRNIPLLLEAFGKAIRAGDLPHGLFIIGPDYLGLKIAELAREHGVAGRVFHAPHTPMADLQHFYRAAEAFVLPTLHEGFSLTIVEAMACGTPAVVFDHAALEGGVREAAYVVKPPTAEALGDAMSRVATDVEFRDRLRETGLACAGEFRWERTARETMEILADAATELRAR